MAITHKLGIFSGLIASALVLSYGVYSQHRLSQQTLTAHRDILPPSRPSISHRSQLSIDELNQRLKEKLPGVELNDLEKSPVSGYYQAYFGDEMVYISGDAKFLFTGQLLELGEAHPINHTQLALAKQDRKLAPQRAVALAKIDEKDMVVFHADNERYQINVFTDVDCVYCRKLHTQVPALNAAGVTVRYLAYPRAGIGSDSYQKLVSIWCADDKQQAMDQAKLERKFTQRSCTNPVADQYQFTRRFHLSGTPVIILPDGDIIGGYLSVDEMLDVLQAREPEDAQPETKAAAAR